MSRLELLEKMVECKNIKDKENFDNYYEAWEELSMTFHVNKSILSKEEAILLLNSFSDKREHPYLKDMLVDAIVIYVKETGDINTFMEEMIKNKEGFYESLWALYFLLAVYPEYKTLVESYLVMTDKQTKQDMLLIYEEYPGYRLEEGLMKILYM